jgi:hypothetical protein
MTYIPPTTPLSSEHPYSTQTTPHDVDRSVSFTDNK